MDERSQVIFVTSEMYPFSKTGGLADVMGALPLTLHRMGIPCAVVTPFYGRLSTAGFKVRLVSESLPVGYPWPSVTAEVYQADYHDMPVYLIGRGEYFDRRFYYNTHQGDYFDNCERFIFFCRAVMSWIRRLQTPPQVINCNDWQSSLIPVSLHYGRMDDPFWSSVKSVMTIHNLAFQGRFSSRLFFESGLPMDCWHADGVEYYGDFNMLKGGIAYADAVSTVSPSYAREILTPEFGCGLEGILGKRAGVLHGILNGADYDVWDPGNDVFLPCCYDALDPAGKKACKCAMIRHMYMSDLLEDKPILGFIGRFRNQKGVDLLMDILPALMEREIGVVVLGEGDLGYEARLLDLMEEFQGRLSVQVGYTEDLAHLIQAGSDIFLMPSRYEPCGLTQMYALRFGTLPVASAVGGLIDTIVPSPSPLATGFTFARPEPDLFMDAIDQALEVWDDKARWGSMLVRAMEQGFTWEVSAQRYAEMYRSIGADL